MSLSPPACRVSVLEVDSLPEQAWKNGGGATRELLCHPPCAGFEDFDWRISIARVAQPGDFSRFPGVDRHIMLIEGASMSLTDKERGSTHVLRPFEPHAFAGEAAIASILPHGPTRDFNLMLRRGRAQGGLRAWQGLAAPAALAAGFHLLYVAQGAYHASLDGQAWPLAAGQALAMTCPAGASLQWLAGGQPGVLVHAFIASSKD